MLNSLAKFLTLIFFLLSALFSNAFSEVVKKIDISGNNRISNETIVMFSTVSINDNLNKKDINDLLIRLYETNFFKNVTVNLNKNILNIKLEENPIIEKIIFTGIYMIVIYARVEAINHTMVIISIFLEKCFFL